MTKDLLQQELLNKVKLGIKPSDLKNSQKLNKIPVSPPPMEIKDEGYSSSEEEKPIFDPNPTISINPNKTPSSVYVLGFQALQKQLQLYKDFKEADLEIKERLKKQLAEKDKIIAELNKTIQNLKTQTKTPPKQTQSTQTEPTHFYCDNCQQNKHGSYLLRKLDSPFEPRTHKKLCYLCSICQKYTKEYNEKPDLEDNPYKLYD